MQIIKYEKLREFMLGLDHEAHDTLKVLVKYYTQYVYTARIIYDSYSYCWRCLSNQTTRGSVRSVAFDHRTVRAYIERDVLAELQGFALEDISMPDEECTLTTLSSWGTRTNTADSFAISNDTSGEPFDAQVLTWLSGSTGAS